jgi:hypothetical protein
MKEKDKKNLPMVEAQEVDPLLTLENQEAIELANGRLGIKKGGNVIIGTLNLVSDPITRHLKNRHEKFYRNSKFHLAVDIILAILVLALSINLFHLYSFEPKAQIDLETTAVPANVVSGQSGVFTIHYKNNGKVDIKSATLSLIFTKNFVLQSVSPENAWSDQSNTFTIGDLPRGAAGSVKVVGVPIGEIGSKQTFNYSLNYLQNGQAVNTLGTYVFTLDSSVLSVSFDAPKQVYQNLDFSGKLNLRNTGASDVTGEIDLAFADSSVVLQSISSDQAILANGVIIVNGLKAGQSVPIEYEAMTNAASGTVPAIVEADLNLDGVKMKQAGADLNLNVAVPKFGAIILADKKIISSDDTVNFKLNFVNKEEVAISSTTINIMPADSSVMLKNLSLSGSADKYKLNGNSIVLGSLAPGESGEIDFTAVLSRKTVSVNQLTGITAYVNYFNNGRLVQYQMFSPKIKILSNFQVSSKGLYYSAQGDQLGVGPLPPVVDVPTNFWIFWELNNNGNELKNVTVSADLPNNVGWTGQKTVLAGDLRNGEISHKVVWTVDDVAATGGNYRAGFELELIPNTSDIGTVPSLISNIQYSATDVFTGQQIVGSLPDINADIKDDLSASGKGKVIKLNVVK